MRNGIFTATINAGKLLKILLFEIANYSDNEIRRESFHSDIHRMINHVKFIPFSFFTGDIERMFRNCLKVYRKNK